MSKILTDQQIQQYHDDGFIAPLRVMPEDEAFSIKTQLEEAERAFSDEFNAENRNNLHLIFSFLDELAHNTVIVDAVEDLIGPDIALWGSVMFTKESSSDHYVSWHQDATYMGMNSNDFLTPWIALTPSNIETGCMAMIPGSHKQNIHRHEDTFSENNILTRGQVVKDVDESKAVNLILNPGEISIHHGAVIHGSKPNKSKQRRIGFALQAYMPPSVKQLIGKNIWMHVRGKQRQDLDRVALKRPQYDMDSSSVLQRKLVNENYSNILYKGSKTKRKY
jgi:ectoine hydroxylase-related dioxygenase (phytanoyl-CoA dioxygenase family)|tara:strand:- start:184 stop:1017 length:834 start_codon:yes stop_codon:yes gene_type:complete